MLINVLFFIIIIMSSFCMYRSIRNGKIYSLYCSNNIMINIFNHNNK